VPLDLLAEQATSRVPELVPIRHGRMAASPFAYYRGAALPMAADRFASAYADQNDADHEAVRDAINAGTVPAETTV
jgi:Uncharacterized protein conserved in bacteria (DUF2252)